MVHSAAVRTRDTDCKYFPPQDGMLQGANKDFTAGPGQASGHTPSVKQFVQSERCTAITVRTPGAFASVGFQRKAWAVFSATTLMTKA